MARNSRFDQLILEFGTTAEPAWIHIAIGPGQRNDILRINRAGTARLTLATL